MQINIDTINIVILVVALINTSYGFVVYFRNREDKTNRAFFALTLSVSFWDVAMFVYRAAMDVGLAVICARVLYLAASTIPIAFLYFVIVFPKQELKLSLWKKLIIPVPFVVSCFISLVPTLLIENVLFVPNHESIIVFNWWLHAYYALYIVTYFLLAYSILFKKYFRAEKSLKVQLLYIFIGTAISTTIGVATNLILLLFLNNFALNWLGQIGTVVMIASISYAILKYHLFNIKVLAAEVLVFSLWVFILLRSLMSQSGQDRIISLILLLVTAVIGFFLLRSVKKEIEQRERIEKLATELETTNERLTELNRQKSEFVSFASHQLRSPLTAMKGYASLLLEGEMGKLPAAAKEGITRIYDSTNTLVNIVNDYLNISRIELGSMKYTFETVDLRNLVEEVIGELKPNIDKKGVAFSFTADNDGTDYRITADRDKLKQVIGNLIDNSLKYTPSGTISAKLTYNRLKHALIFTIKDTGIGIDPEVLPHLFQKFSRANNANKTNIKGTGLGLFVAKQMIEAQHGTIRAESEGEGKGSTFIVELEPFRQV